jgi:hypothetical protein
MVTVTVTIMACDVVNCGLPYSILHPKVSIFEALSVVILPEV